MKKLKNICLLCFIFNIILLNYNVFAQTGTVTGKNVRLRESATTESKVLSTMSKNEKVEIIGEEENWYNVKYKDKNGYVSKDYVKVEEVTDTTSEKVEENKQEETIKDNSVEVENSNSLDEQTIALGTEYTLQRDTKLRIKPNFSSVILKNLNNGDKIIVNNQIGNWIKISVENENGWILKNSIKIIEETEEQENIKTEEEEEKLEEQSQIENTTENELPENKDEEEKVDTQPEATTPSITKGYVNAETVNVRTGPSTDSKRLGFLDLNDEVEVISEEGEWYKINTKEYGECYIAKRLISPTKVASRGEDTPRNDTVSQEKNEELTSVLNNSNNLGNEIVNFANQYLGYKYVSGGKKPETGFDCSGFTRYVYSNFGISLGATAASQANNTGKEVSRQDLQVGDLILFQDDAKTKIGHCGIYIGNNTFIHAANPKRGVVTDKLDGNSYYSPRYVSAYRF